MKQTIKYFDGGMGTSLSLKAGELPEMLNITEPERVYAVHKAYAAAGADIISTNTFGANSLKYDNVEEIVKAGVGLAKKTGKQIALDIGPLGRLLKPMGDLSFEECVSIYKRTISAGQDGADYILLETMSDTYELKAAMLAAKEVSSLPIIVSMMFGQSKRLLTGADIKTACTIAEALGAYAFGFNCGLGPDNMLPLVGELKQHTSLPIIIMPNAGLPEVKNGQTLYNVSPEEFAECMREIANNGVSFLGGCCGTTPEHISKTISATRDIGAKLPEIKNETVITSGSKSVTLGKEDIIIGAQTVPANNEPSAGALKGADIEYFLDEGFSQIDAGADVLDVSAGFMETNEEKMLPEIVYSLQEMLNAPLQLNFTSPAALEAALRIYNGKPLINSVNVKREGMDEIFPIIKKYGGVVVCSCLDENTLFETAKKYGIDKKNIIIDA